MRALSRMILRLVGVLRPILLKLFPTKWLRGVKRKMVAGSIGNLERLAIRPYEPGHYPTGVNLLGDMQAETGLGQSCRMVASSLEQTGIPLAIRHCSQMGDQKTADHSWDDHFQSDCIYGMNVIHINPHELGVTFLQMERETWDYRYQIAYWLWELEEFPEEWTPFFQVLDEIWAPSEFICDAIRKKTDLPVRCMPYHVDVMRKKEYTREDFHLPEDQFLFLMMYDHNSGMERKNPTAVLHAFREAFAPDDKVGLVIKVNHPTKEDEVQIRKELSGYNHIYLIRDTLERDAVNSLTECVDVVVSLHRAEGFGLVLAEAMLLGTPTIATNWSSNTEFMNDEVACMVDYKLVTIEKDLPPFRAGNRWADADVQQAAGYMRRLYEDPAFYRRIQTNAKAHAERVLGKEQAAERMRKRLCEIWEDRESKWEK